MIFGRQDCLIIAAAIAPLLRLHAQDVSSISNASPAQQQWNAHVLNSDVVEWHPDFPAQYSGPNSMNHHSESDETIDLDVTAGLRLWTGAEFHLDGLAWQGFGLSHTIGIEAFPSAEAYKIGARVANATFARVFLRQTINLGGATEQIADDPLHLADTVDESRVVLTIGEFSALDIFDNNAYAGDPTSQFLNWAFVGNLVWDYPASSLGFITGLAAELYQPNWRLRYGFFQVPRQSNGLAEDPDYLSGWGMVTEFERRYLWRNHPGAARLLFYANHAHMGSYQDAVDGPVRPAAIDLTQTYRYKVGVCLNFEQEIFTNVGVFSRLGWSDGENQAWAYTDADRSASLGASVQGGCWNRPLDTYAVAGVVSGLSGVHQQFLQDGGVGILAGDGNLSYGLEKAMETYYSCHLWKSLFVTADFQYVIDPAFNRARGPIPILGGRLHWQF